MGQHPSVYVIIGRATPTGDPQTRVPPGIVVVVTHTTATLSKVFEHLVAVRLGQFVEHCGVLPTTQLAYRKGLGTCDALLCVLYTLQSALERGQEARIVQIDFSAAFDRVNHQGILYGLSSVGIEVLCCLY